MSGHQRDGWLLAPDGVPCSAFQSMYSSRPWSLARDSKDWAWPRGGTHSLIQKTGLKHDCLPNTPLSAPHAWPHLIAPVHLKDECCAILSPFMDEKTKAQKGASHVQGG